MKDDVLRAATRALREEADTSKGREAETRARVLATLKARRARKLAAIRVVVPLAAVLVGSVAWAEATNRLPSVWYEIKHDLGFGRDEEDAPAEVPSNPPTPKSVAKNATPTPPAQTETATATATETETDAAADAAAEAAAAAKTAADPDVPPPSAPHAVAAEVVGAPTVAAPKNTTTTPPPDPSAPSETIPEAPAAAPAPHVDADDALYRAAHQAHFVTRDPAAALAAWDAYLRAAPRGRFAPEAHYNRALCLVRLGRTAEAERTLELFASGSFGGYRKAEAKTLLDAMHGPTQ